MTDPDRPTDPTDHDLADAELAESSGVQNAVAVAGPGALLMVPLARLLTKIQRLLHRPRD